MRLLDATIRCIQLYGVDKTGISDVAREAGVTRRTVYRYFDDRQVLVAAALLRGVEDFARRARAVVDSFEDPSEALVEALCFAMRELPDDPALGSALRGGHVSLNADSLPQALGVIRPLIEPISEAAHWTPEEINESCEFMLRMALSLLTSPRREDLPGFLHRRLIPSLGLTTR